MIAFLFILAAPLSVEQAASFLQTTELPALAEADPCKAVVRAGLAGIVPRDVAASLECAHTNFTAYAKAVADHAELCASKTDPRCASLIVHLRALLVERYVTTGDAAGFARAFTYLVASAVGDAIDDVRAARGLDGAIALAESRPDDAVAQRFALMIFLMALSRNHAESDTPAVAALLQRVAITNSDDSDVGAQSRRWHFEATALVLLKRT